VCTRTLLQAEAVSVQIYREKLRAEVEGRPYTPPPPSSVKPVSRSGSSGSMSRSRSAGRVAAGNDESWDEWGDKVLPRLHRPCSWVPPPHPPRWSVSPCSWLQRQNFAS